MAACFRSRFLAMSRSSAPSNASTSPNARNRFLFGEGWDGDRHSAKRARVYVLLSPANLTLSEELLPRLRVDEMAKVVAFDFTLHRPRDQCRKTLSGLVASWNHGSYARFDGHRLGLHPRCIHWGHPILSSSFIQSRSATETHARESGKQVGSVGPLS